MENQRFESYEIKLIFYKSILIMKISYSMEIVSPYKLLKKENTKTKHCRKKMKKYNVMVSSFSHRPFDRKLRCHS